MILTLIYTLFLALAALSAIGFIASSESSLKCLRTMKNKSDLYLSMILLAIWMMILNQCGQGMAIDEISRELNNINHTLRIRLP